MGAYCLLFVFVPALTGSLPYISLYLVVPLVIFININYLCISRKKKKTICCHMCSHACFFSVSWDSRTLLSGVWCCFPVTHSPATSPSCPLSFGEPVWLLFGPVWFRLGILWPHLVAVLSLFVWLVSYGLFRSRHDNVYQRPTYPMWKINGICQLYYLGSCCQLWSHH